MYNFYIRKPSPVVGIKLISMNLILGCANGYLLGVSQTDRYSCRKSGGWFLWHGSHSLSSWEETILLFIQARVVCLVESSVAGT